MAGLMAVAGLAAVSIQTGGFLAPPKRAATHAVAAHHAGTSWQ